jgi:cytochrome c
MEMLNKLIAASAFAAGFGALAATSALAQDDLVADGEKVFKRCAACHQIGPEAENKVGPELTDVIGRQAGTVEGFKYSDAMVEFGAAGNVWSNELLHTYLENPKALVKGTNMAFAGLKKLEDRDAVIAYIESMQGTLTN